jgi:transposase InsO family protein
MWSKLENIPLCPKTHRLAMIAKSSTKTKLGSCGGVTGASHQSDMLPLSLQFIIATIAYAINARMARRIDYLMEEVRILRETYAEATGQKRIAFTDDQRRRLAVKGKALTPEERKQCYQIVQPSTILSWFRKLAGTRYDSFKQRKKPGRPRKPNEIRELVIRLAQENLGWGYTKIRDALRNLKIEVGRSKVANIWAEAGIEPVPERTRKRTWKRFIRSHWETLDACDFFAVEAFGIFGTVRIMVFFVVELRTRAVHIAGIRINPDGAWMSQIARNLVDPEDGFLRNASHLIHDRDPLFTKAWSALLNSSGVKSVRIPASSPNCNPHAERFVRTIRTECLDHFVIFGERCLRELLREFVTHYHGERFHQGLGGRLVVPRVVSDNDNAVTDTVQCRSRLGGLLNYYHREAA